MYELIISLSYSVPLNSLNISVQILLNIQQITRQ